MVPARDHGGPGRRHRIVLTSAFIVRNSRLSRVIPCGPDPANVLFSAH
jgi:hypothetical protein